MSTWDKTVETGADGASYGIRLCHKLADCGLQDGTAVASYGRRELTGT